MTKFIQKSTQNRLGVFLSRWRNRTVSRQVTPPVLDIACGLNMLAPRFDGGIGVDIQDYGNTDRIVEDFTRMPFDDGSFRTITIVASLNYFDDPTGVMRECARLLTSDGRLVLTLLDPRVGRWWHSFREPWARRPGFDRRGVDQMAQKAGLRVASHQHFMLHLNNVYVLEKKNANA